MLEHGNTAGDKPLHEQLLILGFAKAYDVIVREARRRKDKITITNKMLLSKMIKFWLRRYFTVVFLLGTLLGVLHHHDDLKQHNDCKICLVKSNLSHADTPVDVVFLTDIDLVSEGTVGTLFDLVTTAKPTSLHARAPPKNS